MTPHRLRIRHVAIAFLVGSLLGFVVGPVEAGPLDKAKGKDRERPTDTIDRNGSSDRQRTGDTSRQRLRNTESAASSRTGSSRDVSREAPTGMAPPDAEQHQNLQDLRDSLGVLAGGAAAAEDEIRNLAQDLQGMSLQPPDPALTQALAADLADALADASLSPKEMAELTQAVYAVMNSAGLSQDELEVLIADVEDVLLASGVDRSDVQAVAEDLQAIYDASQGRASGGQSERRARGGMRSLT